MLLIKQLTDDAQQIHTLILPSGKTFKLTLEFMPMQLGWFMSVAFESFAVTNVRIVTSPNILRQFRNILPFGLACFVDGNQEPLLQNDFASGRAGLYVLPPEDVTAVEGFLSG